MNTRTAQPAEERAEWALLLMQEGRFPVAWQIGRLLPEHRDGIVLFGRGRDAHTKPVRNAKHHSSCNSPDTRLGM